MVLLAEEEMSNYAYKSHCNRSFHLPPNQPMIDPQESSLSLLIGMLIRFRFVFFLGVAVLLVVSFPVARKLTFDQRIESLYAKDDPQINNHLESKHLFGGDEFVIVAYHDPSLFVSGNPSNKPELTPEGERRIRELADRLNHVPGVRTENTQHLAQALQFRFARNRTRKLVESILVGKDGQTTAVILRLEDEETLAAPRAETFKTIRQIAATHNPPAYVVGEPLQVHDMFRYVEEDGRVLFRVSLCLLAGVLFFLFARPSLHEVRGAYHQGPAAGIVVLGSLLLRTLQWVGLPLVVVVATIVWTEAILVLTRTKLSMVSSMLNSMVMIIAIATVMHVTVHYRESRRRLDRLAAMRQTLLELLPAIFWTCATTAAGFAALLSSSITPVQSFGMMMALASLLVLTAAACTLPGGILLGRFSTDPRDAPAEAGLVHFLGRVTDWIEHHPRRLGLGAALAVLFAAVGLLRLEVETDFSKNFRESSPIVQGLNFIETRLGGAGTWEVNFSAPDELTEDYLAKVENLARNLREVNKDRPEKPRLTKVVSITDGLDLVPRIPFLLNTIRKRLDQLNRFQPDYESMLYNRGKGRMRIMLRARERQSSEDKLSLIRQVERVAKQEFPEVKVTGLFVLLTFLIESLLSDQLVSFGLAATGIGVMMTLAFRSLRIGLISLVPNFFPIVLVMGAMGWTGLPINIATAMIASVSMGLTVDSTIHYIAAYRRARSRQLSIMDALRETHQGVGRALVFANLALIVGFTVLSLSHFIPLVYFGLLLSVAMLSGLIGDLVLLPLLLKWADENR